MGLKGPLRPKNNLANIVSFSQPLRGQRRANTPVIKTQTGLSLSLLSSPSPATHQPQALTAPNTGGDRISPQTSKHNMKIKHTETHRNTHRHTHSHSSSYTTHPLVSAVILTMLVGDLGCRVGGWVKRGGRYEMRGVRGRLVGLEGEVRLKAVNVFMEKRGLSTWLNQGAVGNFMGEGWQLWML